jgi:hypothetical protein
MPNFETINHPDFLIRGGSVAPVKVKPARRKRRTKFKLVPPKQLGKTWDARFKKSQFVRMHFNNEHSQLSGVHCMWAFVGHKWVHLSTARGSVRFKMKRADYERMKPEVLA